MESDLQGLLDFQRSFTAGRQNLEGDLHSKQEPQTGGYIFKEKLQRGNLRGAGKSIAITNLDKYLSGPAPDPAALEAAAARIGSYHDYWKILEDHYTNPLSSVVVSKTMLLPHQVQAALHVVDSVRPRVLIADEVGLGKTIEAGLILKELLLKYGYSSVLIAVPAPLIYQWAAELHEKFNEDFTIITGPVLRRDPTILERSPKVIVSIDLLRDPRHWQKFLDQDYEVAVFDEAHRLRKDGNKTTRGYQFAEKVSASCRALILLSATPFRGKIEEIYYLIQLIDPDILGPYHSFMNRFGEGAQGLREKLSPVVIRRRKIEVGGFTRRFASTVKLTLNPPERAFYDAVSEYVRTEYNRALESEQSARAFVMVIYQKLLDSSCYAVGEALRKRKERLEEIYFRHARPGSGEGGEGESDLFGEELFGDAAGLDTGLYADLEYEEAPEEMIDGETVFNPLEIRKEIFSLTRLIEMGRRIESDSKLNALKNSLVKSKKAGHEKIIIFTQFKKTLFYLAENLREYKVTVFHGGMSGREKEAAIEEFFQTTEILICTEAGGEGRNLQAASVLVNYDLPWSPLRIEQRIGRIHRFGQKSDVYILNFATKDTIAEKVLEILERKIMLFEDAFGGSDVLLGSTEDDTGFERHIRELLGNKKTGREIEIEIESSAKIAKENLHKIDSLLSTEVMDFNMAAFQSVVEKKEAQDDAQEILKKIAAHESGFFKGLGGLGEAGGVATFEFDGAIRQGSFSPELCEENPGVEFLTVGHPYVDSLISRMVRSLEGGAVYRAKGSRKGVVLYVAAKIHLDRVYNRVYRLFFDESSGQVEFGAPPQMLQSRAAAPGEFSQKEIKTRLEGPLKGLREKLEAEAAKLRKKIMPDVNYWKKNVNQAYYTRDGELGERLEIQRGKSAWYGERKMVGAISRTMNQRRSERQRATSKIDGLESILSEKIEVEIRHLCFLGPTEG